MEKIKHGQVSTAATQRYGAHAIGYDAVANGDAARERERAGKLMVAVPQQDGPITQLRLKVRVNADASNPIYEPYTELWDYDMDFDVGERAYDSETRTYYTFVDVSNRAYPRLRNDLTGVVSTYDAKRDQWILPSTTSTAPSSSSNASTVEDVPMDASLSTVTESVSNTTSQVSTSASSRRKSRWDMTSATTSEVAPMTVQDEVKPKTVLPASFSSISSFSGSSSSSNTSAPPSHSSASSALSASAMPRAMVSASSSSSSSSAVATADGDAKAKPRKYKILFNDEGHFTKHMVNFERGQSHSVFIGTKKEVWQITEEAVEHIKGISASWTTTEKKKKYSFDAKRIVGFQGETSGRMAGYPMTTRVEGYYNFSFNPETNTVTIFLVTAYPGGPYDQGTLDTNGYRLNEKGRAVLK